MRKLLLTLLLPVHAVLATPAGLWEQADPASLATLDHSAWEGVLAAYVHRGDDGIHRVDYNGLRGSDDAAVLATYIRSLEAADPRTLNPAEQMAFWINLYNAVTVQVVLDHPGKNSIKRMGRGWLPFGPWDDKLVQVLEVELTLNDIEHNILRPIFQDHRIHYAVNCASIGCPNLQRTAFTGATLEAQLASAEAQYLNHPRGVRIDTAGRVHLSSIYKWYRDDFAADEAGLLTHLAERHTQLGPTLASYAGDIEYDYDWSLNRRAPDKAK
ncbi:MAG: DUF547 domain-containing protein [Pseudomonadota bacterium]